MERLSDNAIEIINALHTERLEYSSEYLPLIDAAHRLAAYEDTGLTPEEINELPAVWVEKVKELQPYLEANREGRLLVLPCKVGDEVWLIEDDDIYHLRVQGISASVSGRDCILHFGGYPVRNMWGSAFGKVVFHTRAEAEAALRGGNDHA